jgi:hypothetical protein
MARHVIRLGCAGCGIPVRERREMLGVLIAWALLTLVAGWASARVVVKADLNAVVTIVLLLFVIVISGVFVLLLMWLVSVVRVVG